MASAEMIGWLLMRDMSAPLVAHELAEKLRDMSASHSGCPEECDGIRLAADFIDPEAP